MSGQKLKHGHENLEHDELEEEGNARKLEMTQQTKISKAIFKKMLNTKL